MLLSSIFALSLALASVNAHMRMSSPPALGSKDNPNTPPGQVDYNYETPLSASGENFPCKGKLSLLSGPAGKAVASWPAGSQQSVTILGGAAHQGGSCQLSFSMDSGATFKVIKSFIGNCPVSGSGNFPFTVPVGAKAGNAILAWTWFNKVGNREMYMDCASVSITGSGTDNLSSYPDIFVANIGNGCSTTEGVDLMFPNPGKVVLNTSKNTGPPVGKCGIAGTAPPPPSPPPAKPTFTTSKPLGPPYPTPTLPATSAVKKMDDGMYRPPVTSTTTPGTAATLPKKMDDGMYRPPLSSITVKPPGAPSQVTPNISDQYEYSAPPSTLVDNPQAGGDGIAPDCDVSKKKPGTANLAKNRPSTVQYRRRLMRFRR